MVAITNNGQIVGKLESRKIDAKFTYQTYVNNQMIKVGKTKEETFHNLFTFAANVQEEIFKLNAQIEESDYQFFLEEVHDRMNSDKYNVSKSTYKKLCRTYDKFVNATGTSGMDKFIEKQFNKINETNIENQILDSFTTKVSTPSTSVMDLTLEVPSNLDDLPTADDLPMTSTKKAIDQMKQSIDKTDAIKSYKETLKDLKEIAWYLSEFTMTSKEFNLVKDFYFFRDERPKPDSTSKLEKSIAQATMNICLAKKYGMEAEVEKMMSEVGLAAEFIGIVSRDIMEKYGEIDKNGEEQGSWFLR